MIATDDYIHPRSMVYQVTPINIYIWFIQIYYLTYGQNVLAIDYSLWNRGTVSMGRKRAWTAASRSLMQPHTTTVVVSCLRRWFSEANKTRKNSKHLRLRAMASCGKQLLATVVLVSRRMTCTKVLPYLLQVQTGVPQSRYRCPLFSHQMEKWEKHWLRVVLSFLS